MKFVTVRSAIVFVVVVLVMSMLCFSQVADNENFLKNGSFEDENSIEMIVPEGFTCTISRNLEASAGVYSLCVKSEKNYGHIGFPVSLEEGRTYAYSFDVKLVSDGKGNAVSSPIAMYVNFMFADSLATNAGKNHVLTGVAASSDSGWHHVTGTYTPSFSEIATDSDLENAHFCIYANPTVGGGAVWLLDNVVLKRLPVGYKEPTLKTSALISDNMLIQKGKAFTVKGTVENSSGFDVILYDGEKEVSSAFAKVNNGDFEATLPVIDKYYNNLEMRFVQDGVVVKTVKNVAVGELWHFSGQSNMEANSRDHMPDLISGENLPDVRYFRTESGKTGKWVTISDYNVRSISAIAYKTLEVLYNGLGGDIPVGGINTAIGGMPIADYMENGSKYNDFVLQAAEFPVTGHFWYQGESDMKNNHYAQDLETMIDNWRTLWKDDSQAFIYVQLPRSCASVPDWYGHLDQNGNPTVSWSYDYTNVHMQQYEAYENLKDDNVFMVVTIDSTTEIEDQKSVEDRNAQDPLHPWNKAPIATRLANTALYEIYGKTQVKHLYPMPENVTADGKYVYIEYSGVYDGLVITGDTLEQFEVIDEDGKYHTPTMAKLYSDDTVMLFCDEVETPYGICYFHENHLVDMSLPFQKLVPSLENSAGLPASPFTYVITDDDRVTYYDKITVPEDSAVYFVNGQRMYYDDETEINVPKQEGYIYVNSGYDAHVLYRVNENGTLFEVSEFDDAILGFDGASIRTTGVQGIRFRGSVSDSSKQLSLTDDDYEIKEYGFVVTAENDETGLKDTEYTLDLNLVCDGKAVKGVAYNKENGTDIIYDVTDERTVFTGVLKNIPQTSDALMTRIASRPYYILSDGNNETVIYGEITIRSVYGVARAIKDIGGKDYTDNQEYIDNILKIVTTALDNDEKTTFVDITALYAE